MQELLAKFRKNFDLCLQQNRDGLSDSASLRIDRSSDLKNPNTCLYIDLEVTRTTGRAFLETPEHPLLNTPS